MAIKIRSEREGFRRCGIAHSVKETVYSDDQFFPDEIARLQAEPMLTVVQDAILKEKVGIDIKPARKTVKNKKRKRGNKK